MQRYSISTLILTILPISAIAVPVGPGTVTTPVVQSNGGTTTIAGDTTIKPGTSAHSVSVTSGTVEIGGPNIAVYSESTGFAFNVDSSSNLSYLKSLTGSTLNIITTGTTYSYGIWATNPNQRATGLMVDLNNVTINTAGNGSGGVIFSFYAQGRVSNLNINTTGSRDPGNNNAGAYGINTQNNASGIFSNVNIHTSGANSTGVLNTNLSSFEANNIVATVEGDGAYGINTQTGSVSILNNANVTTKGSSGIGLRVSCANFSTTETFSRLTGDNLHVTTYGTSASAVMIRNESIADLSHVYVNTSGTDAVGLYSIGLGDLTVNHSTVRTLGESAYGAASRTVSILKLNDTHIETYGIGAGGLYVEAATLNPQTTTATMSNSSINTYGALSAGLEVQNGGVINSMDSTIRAHGAGSIGLAIYAEPEYLNIVNLSNNTLISDTAAGIGILGGTSEVSLDNTVVTGAVNWLVVGSPYITPLPAVLPLPSDGDDNNETLFFAPNKVNTPSTSLMAPPETVATIIANRSELNGAAITYDDGISTVVLENESLWNMTGSSNLTALTNSLSTISFSAPTGGVFKTLTATNYVGQQGLIVMHTFLQEDGSPSDKLVITGGGTATGSTGLYILNAGGEGALTIANGILVVDATDGTTTADAFHLTHPVVAGPYNYTLHYGSEDDTGPDNWYLRSSIGPGPDPIPDYRREVSLYTALPSTFMNYSRAVLGTFHRRVGEEEQVHNLRAKKLNTSYMNGGWMRVINRGGNVHNRTVMDNGPNFHYQTFALQAGVDVFHHEYGNDQREFAGFYFTGGGNYSSVKHYTGVNAGHANSDAYGFGLYWTHIGKNNWYVDGVFQGNYFIPNVHSQYYSLGYLKGQSYSVSLESGYPFHVSEHWSIEPEGQLIYQNLPGTRSGDLAADVRFASTDSFISRLGTRLVWNKLSADEHNVQPKTTVWLTPSFSYESQGVSKTSFSSETGWIPFYSKLKGPWFSLDLGGTVQINPIVSLYGTVAGETYLNGRGQAYDVMAGLRFNI